MKAVRLHEFGAPEVLQVDDVPDPKPATGQVVVRLKAIGVNPVETYIRSGIYARPATPLCLGSDGAGIVECIGDEVMDVQVGDRVYTAGSLTGTYAELALCKTTQVFPLPQRASFAQGAAINIPYGTAYQAMFHRGRAKPGESVLIHGASGGVGIASIQLARAAGLRVIGTAGTDRGRELVLDQGAHHVLDHNQEGYLEEIKELSGGQGVDLIMEMLANVNLNDDLELLAKYGRVVVIGNRGENNQGKVAVNARAAMARDADILGMTSANASPSERRSLHAALVAGLETGTLQPVIGAELPLSSAVQAHKKIESDKAYGKLVLIP